MRGCVERGTHTDHSPHRMAEWPVWVASFVVSAGDGSTQSEESRGFSDTKGVQMSNGYRAHPDGTSAAPAWASTNRSCGGHAACPAPAGTPTRPDPPARRDGVGLAAD